MFIRNILRALNFHRRYEANSSDNSNALRSNWKLETINSPILSHLLVYLIAVTSFGTLSTFAYFKFLPSQTSIAQQSEDSKPAVLASTTQELKGSLGVNVPAHFNDDVFLKNGLTVTGSATLTTAVIQTLTAPNVIYSITAGSGITITTGQTPTIANSGVLSLGGSTGALNLTAGSGISIDGLKISSSITNPNTFKTITVGSDSFSAGSSTDTFELAAGTGITLATDTTNKKITITGGSVSGWTDDGTTVRLTTIGDSVGIGTADPSSFKLQVAGSIGPNTDNVYSLGSPSYRFNAIYANSVIGATSGSQGYWQRNEQLLSPANITDDLAIGGASTSSALFQVIGSGPSAGNVTTKGSLTVGDSTSDVASFGARIGSILEPTNGSLYDLGSSARRWSTVWGDTANFTNIVTETISLSGTTSNDFIINSDNATDDTQTSTLSFERGSPAVNAQLKWNATGTPSKLFSLNAPLFINQDSGIYDSGTAALIINQIQNQDIFTASAGGLTKFVISNSGHVGIGTTVPSAKLSIQGTNSEAVIGSEMVTNGTFDSTGNWGFGDGWGWDGTAAVHSATVSGDLQPVPSLSVETGFSYVVTLDLNSNTAGVLTVSLGGGSCDGCYINANISGTFSLVIKNTVNANNLNFSAISGFNGTIDNVSVVKITPTNTLASILNSDATTGIEMRSGGSGIGNTFIGLNSGEFNTTGDDNAVLGYGAMQFNTSGIDNTAMGYNALTRNTTGSYNTAVGRLALEDNIIGYENTAVGRLALEDNTTGYYNTAIGDNAMSFLDYGYGNTALGDNAMSSLIYGYGNTALGASVNIQTNGLTNATAIGYQSAVDCSNCLVLGSIDGVNGATANTYVGIGTNAPVAALDVRGLGTTAIASVSGTTSFAGLVVDNKGTGDLFTASSSGLTRFRIANNGEIYGAAGKLFLGTNESINGSLTLYSSGVGITDPSISTDATGALILQGPSGNMTIGETGNATNIIFQESSALTAAASKTLTIGGTNSSVIVNFGDGVTAGTYNFNRTNATYNFGTLTGNITIAGTGGTTPVASISANTSFAGLVVDNKGTGDLFTASSSGLNRFVIKQNGNVGIGTASPSATLDVAGSIRSRTGYSFLQLTNDNINSAITNNVGAMLFYNSRGTSDTSLAYRFHTTTSDTSVFNILNNGNVGIGVDVPTSKLTVSGAIAIANDSGTLSLGRGDNIDEGGQIDFTGAGAYSSWHQDIWRDQMRIWSDTLGAGNNLVLDDGGNVGIGTAGPDRKLDIFDASNPQLRLSQTDGTVYSDFQMTSGGDLVMNVDGVSNQLVLDNGGNVGIGTAAPSNPLDVVSTTLPQIRFGYNTSNYFTTAISASGAATFDAVGSGASFVFNDAMTLGIGGTSNGSLTFATTGANEANPSISANATGDLVLSAPTGTVTVGNGVGDITLDPGASNIVANLTSGNFLMQSNNINFLKFSTLGTLPVASVSANTSFAGLVVDNKGTGDLFTASSSGLSRFVIKQNGNVGIGTTFPTATLDIRGTASLSGNLTFDTAATIGTTKNNTLTIGGATSGMLILKSSNVIVFQNPGTENTFLGENAGNNTLSGSSNTAVGANAGLTLGSGGSNSFFGDNAGKLVSNGSLNSVFGKGAGAQMNSGSSNSFFGYESGRYTTSGVKNSFFGDSSGYANNIGSENSFMGYYAGNSNLDGAGNIFLGFKAGESPKAANANTAGNYNTFIGYESGPGSTTQLTNATALGYQAVVNANNALVLGGTGAYAVRVGIGTATPSATLDLRGFATTALASVSGRTSFAGLVVDNSLGDLFTASSSGLNRFVISQAGNVGIGTTIPSKRLVVANSGSGSGSVDNLRLEYGGNIGDGGALVFGNTNTARDAVIEALTDDSFNISLRFYTFSNTLGERMRITGNGSVGIGTTSPLATLDVRAALGTTAVASVSGRTSFAGLVVDNSLGDLFTASSSGMTRMVLKNNGNFGVGTATPSSALQVGNQGDGTVAVANAWNNFSDVRFKENVNTISDGLSKVMALNGVSFNWRNSGLPSIGFIAQEVEKVVPEIVNTDANGFKSLDYGKTTPLLVNAIHEQQFQLSTFNSQLSTLSAKLDKLETINFLPFSSIATDSSMITIKDSLLVLGSTTTNDLSVANTLSVGNTLNITGNSINTIGTDLEIQSLKQGNISFMADLVVIDTQGNLRVSGNAEFAKDVKVGGVLSAATTEVIVSQTPVIISATEVTSSASAGTLTLKTGEIFLKVNNPNIKSDSLIFVTSKGSTSGLPIYIREQKDGESFTVGVDSALPHNVDFNYQVINQKKEY